MTELAEAAAVVAIAFCSCFVVMVLWEAVTE